MDGLTNAINSLTTATNALKGDGQSGPPEGVTQKDDSLQEALSSLEGEMKALAEAVISLNTSTVNLKDAEQPREPGEEPEGPEKGFLASLKDEFTGILGELGTAFGFGGAKKGEKTFGGKKTTKVKPKAEDLLQLSERDALGSLLIATKLDELKDSKKKDEKGGGLGDIFKGLLKGVAGIALLAAALVVFAGAAMMFSLVDWGPALVGLVMFTGFVVGAIALSKLMAKNLNDFKTLAIGSAMLSAGLLIFSMALVVTAWAAKMIESTGVGGMGGLLVILGVYCAFVIGAAALGRILGESTIDLKNLAIGGILLSVGLMVFSLALVVVSFLSHLVEIDRCIETLVLYGAFVGGAVLLGSMLGKNSKALQDLAIGSILMAVGLVVFSLSLYVVQEIASKVDIANNVFPTLALFSGFVILMAALGVLIEGNIASVIAVAVGSILMTASLFLFAATMKYINDNVTDAAMLQSIKALGLMAIFVGAFGVIGAAITGVIEFIALAAVTFIGIAVAMYAFSKVIDVIQAKKVTGADYANAVAILGLAGVMMAGMIPIGVLAVPAIAATVLFSIWSAMAARSFMDLGSVIGVLNKDSFVEGIKKADSFLVSRDGVTVGKFIKDVIGSLPNPIELALFTVKMMAFEALTVNMAMSFMSLQKVIDSIEYIKDKMPSEKDMEPVLTLMERIVNVMSRAINGVKGTSAKAMEAIGKTVSDVCLGIDTLANVVTKIRSITPAEIDQGSANVKYMITGLFGPGEKGQWSLMTLFSCLQHVGKGAGPAAEALVPISAALGSMSTTVKELVGIQGIDQGIANAAKVGELMSRLAVVFSESAGDTGGLFRSSSSKRLAEAKNSFDEIAVIVTGPIKTLAAGVANLDGINGLGMKLESVMPSDVEGFPGKMKKFASGTVDFKRGMENLGSINAVKLEKLDVVKATLTDISKITLVDTIRPITELLNRTKDLDKVKESMREIGKLAQKAGGLGVASVASAPKLNGNESVRDLVAMLYNQLFEGSGAKISNWPAMKEEKGFFKETTLMPVQNFLQGQ